MLVEYGEDLESVYTDCCDTSELVGDRQIDTYVASCLVLGLGHHLFKARDSFRLILSSFDLLVKDFLVI